MELREYQKKALATVEQYFNAVARWQEKNLKVIEAAGAEAALNVPERAWSDVFNSRPYMTRRNGLGESVPNFCLKIPTGGGKTLLAVKTIDLFQSIYRRENTGFILWIVPSTQIYRQTLNSLRDRDHPYRQHLDIASAGRTLIREKTDIFTPDDVADNLVVMLLMLPSANRRDKETLKVFKDSGGFGAFFPDDDNLERHEELLAGYPNLDTFGDAQGFFGRQVKTSLGNTLRLLKPLIILDEGHKAYSEGAQQTLLGFNPCTVVELSATPKRGSNVLVDIPGVDLAREEMIKLDLHIINKATTDWKNALLASKEKRDDLEAKAREFESNGGRHIRPICLIQVERTGKDQRKARFIHVEDVREYLIHTCALPAEQIAVKSSSKDDIEGIDLLSANCPVRYIITKQALQEGWDCSFAYVLTILTNPSSKDSLTQLVGRILRQPYARKTKMKELDESYVFCFQRSGQKLLESVRKGFQKEGLGDLEGHIVGGYEDGENGKGNMRIVEIRERFRKFADTIYLPVFAIKDGNKWRQVQYEMDILRRIDWDHADFSPVRNLSLSMIEDKDTEVVVGLSDDEKEVIKPHEFVKHKAGGWSIDYLFITRHLTDIIPNPWIAHEAGKEVFEGLIASNDGKLVENNVVLIIEELRKRAEIEKNRLAEETFRKLVIEKKLRFILLKDDVRSRLPSTKRVSKNARTLTRKDGRSLQRSLFDFMPEDEFNQMEKTVAWCLEEQEKLLWWYRNLSRQDYAIQGWRKHRIYADFIMSRVSPEDNTEYDKVFVVETKGLHLKNENTDYKKEVFKLCNRLAEEKSWSELGLEFPEKKVVFRVVYEDEWRNEINQLFGNG